MLDVTKTETPVVSSLPRFGEIYGEQLGPVILARGRAERMVRRCASKVQGHIGRANVLARPLEKGSSCSSIVETGESGNHRAIDISNRSRSQPPQLIRRESWRL